MCSEGSNGLLVEELREAAIAPSQLRPEVTGLLCPYSWVCHQPCVLPTPSCPLQEPRPTLGAVLSNTMGVKAGMPVAPHSLFNVS